MDEIIKAKKKYNRNARFYDLVELPMEKLLYSKWREKYFSPLKGKILDVGIGTGNNIGYYGNHVEVIGIDFSEKMLEIAKRKLTKSSKNNITLKLMDVESLDFADNLFDNVIISSVFCSVPNPVKGLMEIKRVLKPEGIILMIEHVLSKKRFIAILENLLNPPVKFITGVNINRDTGQNIIKSGMKIIKERNLVLFDVFRLFEV